MPQFIPTKPTRRTVGCDSCNKNHAHHSHGSADVDGPDLCCACNPEGCDPEECGVECGCLVEMSVEVVAGVSA